MSSVDDDDRLLASVLRKFIDQDEFISVVGDRVCLDGWAHFLTDDEIAALHRAGAS